ncbi:MAG: hypothetical protein HQ592_05795 [Planctomycetes bacterium]|nr:hypothetical protein [Planctomycetota bacterium]
MKILAISELNGRTEMLDGLQAEKTVGTTLVVSPGALSDGNYAILDSLAKTVEFKRLEIGVAHPG